MPPEVKASSSSRIRQPQAYVFICSYLNFDSPDLPLSSRVGVEGEGSGEQTKCSKFHLAWWSEPTILEPL